MKAKEYFEKYKDLSPEDLHAKVGDIFREMCDDTTKLIKMRNVRNNSGTASIIREMNDKWNALARMFQEKHGAPIMRENGFLNYWKYEIPELKFYI